MKRAMILVLVVACGSRTYTGSGVSAPLREDPVLSDGQVFIPYTREHYENWDDDGGIAKHFSNDAASSGRDVTKRERVGIVVVELRSGACKLTKTTPAARLTPWARLRPLDTEQRTPSGLFVSRSDHQVVVRDATRTRPLVPDPKNAALWLVDTDGIVLGNRLVDVVDDEVFDFSGGVARLGETLFLPTSGGVVELTAAPITKVADHTPPSLLPTDVRWLPETKLTEGPIADGLTLVRDGTKLVLERKHGRVLLGENIEVRVIGDRYIIGDRVIYDRKEAHVVSSAPPITRIGEYRGYLMLESEGKFLRSVQGLNWILPFEVDTRALGINGNTIVMHTYEREAVFVFDLATRTWHELSYATCVPRR